MQRNPVAPSLSDPPRVLQAPGLGLTLCVSADMPPTWLTRLQADLPRLVERLRPWGTFVRPVHVSLLADLAAGVSTRLRAHATDTTVTVDPEVLNWPSARWQSLWVHELAHVLMFQRATPPHHPRPVLSTWFVEGAALLAADGPPSPHERRCVASWPDVADLLIADLTQTGTDSARVYVAAAHAFSTWIACFGQLGLASTYAALRRGHGFDAALTTGTGTGEAVYLARWLEDLRAEARRH